LSRPEVCDLWRCVPESAAVAQRDSDEGRASIADGVGLE